MDATYIEELVLALTVEGGANVAVLLESPSGRHDVLD
jgi:hypothetical protein